MPIRKSTSANTTRARTTTAIRPRKHVGDLLGISNARVPKGVVRATADRRGNPEGIELPRPRRQSGRLTPVRVRG